MRVLGALLSLAKHGLLHKRAYRLYRVRRVHCFSILKYFDLVGSWCKTDLRCLGSLFQFAF